MTAAFRRGACPSLSEPMKTGDGLLARLAFSGGAKPEALGVVAEAAARFGNGILEVSARGNLQIRGLRPETVAPMEEAVSALGLGLRAGVPVETGPLAGLDPEEIADPRKLADEIREAVAAARLNGRLGPKVSVVVDGGGCIGLDTLIADVRLKAMPGGKWALSIGGNGSTARPLGMTSGEQACATAVALLEAIAALGPAARGRDLDQACISGSSSACRHLLPVNGEKVAGRDGGASSFSPFTGRRCRQADEGQVPRPPVGLLSLAGGKTALGIALPFGQIGSESLAAFAQATGEAGVTELRFAPGRALLALPLDRAVATGLREQAARIGFVTDSHDPRLTVAACPGLPACASGYLAARDIAREIAAGLPPATPDLPRLHVSGCAKRCAAPAGESLALVGTASGAELWLDGTDERAPLARVANAAAADAFGRVAAFLLAHKRDGETPAGFAARVGRARIASLFERA